jgi:ABC-2 type transport system permease protein
VLIFLLPIFQILLYGYAINLEPRNVTLAVATSERALVDPAMDAIKANPVLKLTGPVLPAGGAERAVRGREAQIGVEVTRDAATGAPSVRIIADAADPAEVRPALAELEVGIWKSVAVSVAQGQAPKVDLVWLPDAGGATAWVIAPGLIGMIVMVTMLFLGALTLVRERERGSWESLLATPVLPSEALIGKLAPYLAISLMQTVMMLLLIHWLFAVPLPPATWALVLVSPLFAGAYLVLGFAVSTIAQTQIQAVQAAVFCYLPSLMLSGFMFPFNGMPRWAQIIGEALPLTHYIRATRDILLRGEGPASLLPHLVPVVIFTALAGAAAIASYRRHLD